MPTATGRGDLAENRPLNKSLLDTDIFSEITKGVNPTVTVHATAYRQAFARYTLSAVTFMEVVRGYQKKQATRQLQSFLTAVASEEVIPFDRHAAELAGHIAGELERIGHPIGLADPMIAALALTHGMELVTGNTAHFQRVQNLGYTLILVTWRPMIRLRPPHSVPRRMACVVMLAPVSGRNRILLVTSHITNPANPALPAASASVPLG